MEGARSAAQLSSMFMKSMYENFRDSIASRLRTHFREKEQLEDIAFAMGEMLKLPLQQARHLAREGVAQRTQINKIPQSKNFTNALVTLRNMTVPLDLPHASRELESHAESAYLLSLPFTASAMSFIAHLVRDNQRRFRIVDTRITRYYFYPFVMAQETRERVQLISAAAMLRDHRTRLEQRAGDAVTYVTFPDLETTSLDTARRVPFMGEDYQFSTLEPLLFFRGLAPLYTFDAGEFATARRIKLVACPVARAGAVTDNDIDAVLGWLAKNMELVFREVAADVLSWADMRMLAYSVKATTAAMKLKMIEGYVRAWKAADPNFKDATFVRSIAELRAVQETIDKERLAAISS